MLITDTEKNIKYPLVSPDIIPDIINYNRKETDRYSKLEGALGIDDLAKSDSALNRQVGITRIIQEGKNTVIAGE